MQLLRYCRLVHEAEEGGPVLPLDDRKVRARRRLDEKLEQLCAGEKKRLSALERHERKARRDGFFIVAGVDEVGRGPLAGPLVAAAVIFEKQPWIPALNDSKKLSLEEREALFPLIVRRAQCHGVGTVTVEELNASNIHKATLLAMTRALAGLECTPHCILVDGRHAVPHLPVPQRTLVKGDALSISIAAASIVAKVTRDRFMIEMDRMYPQYGFRSHKGYSTPEHLAALREHGPCPLHRALFAPVASLLDSQMQLWDEEKVSDTFFEHTVT